MVVAGSCRPSSGDHLTKMLLVAMSLSSRCPTICCRCRMKEPPEVVGRDGGAVHIACCRWTRGWSSSRLMPVEVELGRDSWRIRLGFVFFLGLMLQYLASGLARCLCLT